MDVKVALDRIKRINLYHEEIYEDEDLDGNLVFEKFTEYDGTVGDLYAEEIRCIEEYIKRLTCAD